eukprot:CAMPEP_0172809158 /NCGR_PEP_ID=MMETSP1075-20121228/8081_1 /TAXON_ID=2916 /ORGANISM="Ceratium fusus, Strain PA161109" /LENGTH=648 /DNA_ID=CAMNT_0013648361 /DNA_START=71 /DNA_END=2013 /DNA_ORIENTATION=+
MATVEATSTCASCGTRATTICGHCRGETYCGRDCQAKHWKTHKVTCKQPIAQNSKTAQATASGAAFSAASRSPKTQISGATVVPLCGEGFRQWLLNQQACGGAGWRSGPQHVAKPVVGLQNWDNSCYLNAVIQLLAHTPLLHESLLTACTPVDQALQTVAGSWLSELRHLVVELVGRAEASTGSSAVFPAPASAAGLAALLRKSSKEFAEGRQADAHEALMALLNGLLSDCLATGDGAYTGDLRATSLPTKERFERSSLIGHVFGMDLGQTVRCSSCSYESSLKRTEYCLCISALLGTSESKRHMLKYQGETSASLTAGGPGGTSLERLLEEHTRGEYIETYRCEKCHSMGCTRKAFLAETPNILIVCIDRRQDVELYGKVNRRVDFGLRLDLASCMGTGSSCTGAERGRDMYTLYGLVVHNDFNRSTFCGHYVSYVRDRNSQWCLVDDARISPAAWSEVREQSPYLLFYAADTVQPPKALVEASATTDQRPNLKAFQPTLRGLPISSGSSSRSTTAADGSATSSPRSWATPTSRSVASSAMAWPGSARAATGSVHESVEPLVTPEPVELLATKSPSADNSQGPSVVIDPRRGPKSEATVVESHTRCSDGGGSGGGGLFDFDELEEAEARLAQKRAEANGQQHMAPAA